MTTVVWACLTAIAALWPGRLAGPLDGVPLDAPLEALVIGVLLVWLVVLHPRVLRQRIPRALVIALLSWKAATGAALVQDGWCLRFTTPVPVFVDGVTVPHSWDVRADWRSTVPQCSAIMTRGYEELERFPAWFYNLAPANFRDPVRPEDRPPVATSRLDLVGFLDARQPGRLRIAAGEDVETSAAIDGTEFLKPALEAGVPIGEGLHRVSLRGDLRKSHWSLAVLWNGFNVWSTTTATVEAPSTLDLWLRPWGRFIPAALIAGLLMFSAIELSRQATSASLMLYTAVATVVAALIPSAAGDSLRRAVPLLLLGAAAIEVPRRARNYFGWSLLVALPFAALMAAIGLPQAGLFTWYSSGDDWWMFQRFAYRIYMQGHWLEAGEKAFWFQPFYRWVAGGLHMAFGDSSVGELYWDAAAALTGSAFTFSVTRSVAGFRWGVGASCVTLAVFLLGPGWYFFGRGMSEFTSAGFLYGAALLAMRGRAGSWPATATAGLLAVLAFYTRLNNFPMALAVAVFAIPIRVPIGEVWSPTQLWKSASKPVVASVIGTFAVGVHLFTLRTWYYTGVYSMLFGTSTVDNTVRRAGETLVESLSASVLMVLTMNDPPQFDVRALPVLAGFLAAVLGVAAVRPFRRLPMAPVLFCLAGISSTFVARGVTYPARFSLHMIPVTVTLAACATALVFRRDRAASKPSNPARARR